MDLTDLLLLIFGAVGTAFGIYFALTSLGGFLFGKKKDVPACPPSRRIAAVIPARNEEKVIGGIVSSLLAQDYPRELFDVYVVPNNCTDGTRAAALAAGARILECSGPVTRKGDALRQAFAALSGTGRYDAYCVFDADNVAGPGFFKCVNDALCGGLEAAQGFRDSRDPFAGWVAGSMSVFYWFMSRFFNESRSRLSLSCHLNGTGFMVSDRLIRKIGWNTHTLTEDLEFTALCALHGERIGWMRGARVYDEQPVRFKDSAVQRRRWTSGSLQCTRRYSLRLIRKGTRCSLDIGCLFLGNLLNYTGILSFPLLVARAARSFGSGGASLSAALGYALLYAAALYALLALGAALMYGLEGRLCRRSLPGIFGFPVFMATWVAVNLWASLTKAPSWRAVPHIGAEAEKQSRAQILPRPAAAGAKRSGAQRRPKA